MEYGYSSICFTGAVVDAYFSSDANYFQHYHLLDDWSVLFCHL